MVKGITCGAQSIMKVVLESYVTKRDKKAALVYEESLCGAMDHPTRLLQSAWVYGAAARARLSRKAGY